MAPKYKWDTPEKPPVTQPWKSGDSLGQKIETVFVRFVQRVILWGIDFIADRLVDVFDQQMKIMQPGINRATVGVFPHLKGIKGMPPFFYEIMENIEKETGETTFFTKIIVLYATVRGIIFGGLQPYADLANQWALNNVRTWIPDVATTSFLYRIGQIDQTAYNNILGGLGVPDGLKAKMFELSRNPPTTGEIIAGLWRGVYSEAQFKEIMRRTGRDDKDIELYLELSKNIPPLSDQIRFLVRDAFNEDASRRYGYDEDFPPEINQFFEKQGYSADWAKRYWRSHWDLPSPTQAYEMLHRGLIDRNDLLTLLKIADYPPFWREKLEKISYNVLTRVDVRRLLQSGLIDQGKALETYKAMGYTPEDAQLLTEFAVRGISQDERDLTKTDVLNLYEEGLTDRGVTHDNLMKMGYDSQEADSIIALSDVAIAKSARTDLINYTKERYLARKVDEPTARRELSEIGLRVQSVDRYLLNWNRATEIEDNIPSVADVKRWYLFDYITVEQFRSYMKLHRHTDANIALYLRELDDKKGSGENV